MEEANPNQVEVLVLAPEPSQEMRRTVMLSGNEPFNQQNLYEVSQIGAMPPSPVEVI